MHVRIHASMYVSTVEASRSHPWVCFIIAYTKEDSQQLATRVLSAARIERQ